MSHSAIAFGPGESCIFSHPSMSLQETKSQSATFVSQVGFRLDLPKGLEKTFQAVPMKQVYTIAYHQKAYVIVYEDMDGEDQIQLMGLPPALRMWLHERIKGRLARDLPTLRICLGPNGSYIAIDSTGYIIWGEEMDTALIALRELRKGGWKQYPRILALGHGGQFAMITNKNVGCWDPNLCPQITEILDTCTMKSIQNIALNPWNPAHFILQTTDDQVFVGGLSPSLRERADAFADSLVRSRRRAEEAKRKAEEENDNNYLMELGRRRHDRAEMRLLSQKEIKDNQLRYERARRLADSVSSQVIQAKYRPKTSSQLGMMANGKLFNLGVHML